MRIRPESQVRLALPILQIVPRLEPRPRKIGNLIPLNPRPRQPLHRRLIEIGNSIFPRNVARAIPRPQHQQLPPQPAVLVYFQHVNRHMRNVQPLHPIERLPPARRRLPRQPRDQIDADRFDTRLTKKPDFLLDNLRRMPPSRARQFLLHERLHAQTHPIDPRIAPRRDLFRPSFPPAQLPWSPRAMAARESPPESTPAPPAAI